MFTSEEELHENIHRFLSSNLSYNENFMVESEVKGLFGVPDLVLAENHDGSIKHVIAIELKLFSWKRALMQAFRYRSFAWESYVILDEKRSSAAVDNIDSFKKHNIGLATYDKNGSFKIIHKPRIKQPYSLNLFEKICSVFSGKSSGYNIKPVRPNRQIGLGCAFQNLPRCNREAIIV